MSMQDMSPDDVQRRLLEVQEESLAIDQRNFQISQQTRDENAKAKEAQRQQSRFDIEDRVEDATFGLSKAWGQALLTTVGMGARFVSPKYQKYVQGPLEGLNQIFGAATAIRESQRALNLALKQKADLDPETPNTPSPEGQGDRVGIHASGQASPPTPPTGLQV